MRQSLNKIWLFRYLLVHPFSHWNYKLTLEKTERAIQRDWQYSVHKTQEERQIEQKKATK